MSLKSNVYPAPDKSELRKFGYITGGIAAVLFGIVLPWLFGHGYPMWPWIIAGILWVWATIAPSTLMPVYKGWMAIGHVLGWINTRIILGIIFYLMFLPVGMVMRLFGKDPMARKIDNSISSYRVVHAIPRKNHVEKPY